MSTNPDVTSMHIFERPDAASVGRIVHFYDGTYGPAAAIVVSVPPAGIDQGLVVDLAVFEPAMGMLPEGIPGVHHTPKVPHEVIAGDSPLRWVWPPRV